MKNKLKSDFIDACPVCSVKNPMPLIRDIALTCDPEHLEKGVFCENCGRTMPLSSSNAKTDGAVKRPVE